MKILLSTITFLTSVCLFAQFEQVGYTTSMAAGRLSGGTTESIITGGGLVSASKEYGGDYFQFNGFLAAHAVAFTIAPRTTPVIDFTLESKTYGDAEFDLSASSNSATEISYSSNNDEVLSLSENTATINNAGEVTISITQDENEFYLMGSTDQVVVINKASLDVIASDETITYGDSEPGYSYTYSGFVKEENEDVLDSEPTAVSPATTVGDVGTYSLQIAEDGTDNNYAFNYIDGTLTVTQAELLITADDQSISYGDPEPAYTFTYSGFLNSETAEVLDVEPSGITAPSAGNVGTYSLEVEEDGVDNNYAFIYQSGTLTINKANLTITADDLTVNEGDELPEITLSYTGFVNNEDKSVLDELPGSSINTNNTNNPGTYDITLSGGSDNNYSLSLINGTLIVEAVETTLGLDDSHMHLFPNPVVQSFQIGNFKEKSQGQLMLITMEGKVIKRFPYQESTKYDVSDLSKGTYLVMFADPEKALYLGQIIKK